MQNGPYLGFDRGLTSSSSRLLASSNCVKVFWVDIVALDGSPKLALVTLVRSTELDLEPNPSDKIISNGCKTSAASPNLSYAGLKWAKWRYWSCSYCSVAWRTSHCGRTSTTQQLDCLSLGHWLGVHQIQQKLRYRSNRLKFSWGPV